MLAMNTNAQVFALLVAALGFGAMGCSSDPSSGDGSEASNEEDAYRLGGKPRVPGWNYVCTSDASMWRDSSERGNAQWTLCGDACSSPAPVYVYDTQHGGRAAHGTAIIPKHHGSPWPGEYVSGYLNIQNLCPCSRNDPRSCSPYSGVVRSGGVY